MAEQSQVCKDALSAEKCHLFADKSVKLAPAARTETDLQRQIRQLIEQTQRKWTCRDARIMTEQSLV